MARSMWALCCALVLLMPTPGQAAAAEIFPKLRRKGHVQTQQLATARTAKPEAAEGADETVAPAPEADADTPEDSLPAVPAAVDVGPDGLPELPAVDSMLGNATNMLSQVASQYQILEAKLQQQQKASQTKMAKQKTVFEQKLKDQEEGNRVVITENTKIKAEIDELKKGNDVFREHSKVVQESSRVMRSELHALQTKIGSARNFVAKSLEDTDDSAAKDLVVLQTSDVSTSHHKAHHGFGHRALVQVAQESDNEDDDSSEDNAHSRDNEDEDDQADGDGDDDSKSVSFLGLSSRVRRGDNSDVDVDGGAEPQGSPQAPSDLLDTLSKGIDHVADEQKAQEAKLKAIFRKNFQAGSRRHASLLMHQKSLKAEKASLTSLQAKLHTAEEHVEGTEKDLQQRLRGLGLFIQHLGHLALAPVAEAPRLLKALPQAVTIAASETKKEA